MSATDGQVFKFLRTLKMQTVPGSRSRLPLWRSTLLTPVVFAIWFHGRRVYWKLRGYSLRQLDTASGVSSFVANEVINHNLGNMALINRSRTERLIQVMRNVGGFKIGQTDLLVIGPRNEAENLLFIAYGVPPARLRSIDLFTCCPTIELMDMHAMKFADNTFGAIYSSFVITYSDDIPRAVEETIRVCKDGALVAFGFQHLPSGGGNKFGLNQLSGGAKDLLSLFQANVRKIIWSEDYMQADGSFSCSAIFILSK